MINEYMVAIGLAVFALGATIGSAITHENINQEQLLEDTRQLEKVVDCIELGGEFDFVKDNCQLNWEN